MESEKKPFCPLQAISRSSAVECAASRCALWINNDGCAIAVIAKEMKSASWDIGSAADGIVEINDGLSAVSNAVKGLV